MKTTELRIGNYVTDGTFQYSVVGINFDESIWGSIDKVVNHAKAETEDYYKQGDYHLNIENIEPIKLTEEWLLKFGAKKINHIHGYVFWTFHNTKQNNCLIDIYENGNNTEVNSRVVNPCKYVHQLQNLYFALTGNELEIKE